MLEIKFQTIGRSVDCGRLFFLSMLVPDAATRRAFIKRQTVKTIRGTFRARRNLSPSLDHVAFAGMNSGDHWTARAGENLTAAGGKIVPGIVMRRGVCEQNAGFPRPS